MDKKTWLNTSELSLKIKVAYLINEGSSVGGHLENDLLWDLPDGLVEGLELVRQVQILRRRKR